MVRSQCEIHVLNFPSKSIRNFCSDQLAMSRSHFVAVHSPTHTSTPRSHSRGIKKSCFRLSVLVLLKSYQSSCQTSDRTYLIWNAFYVIQAWCMSILSNSGTLTLQTLLSCVLLFIKRKIKNSIKKAGILCGQAAWLEQFESAAIKHFAFRCLVCLATTGSLKASKLDWIRSQFLAKSSCMYESKQEIKIRTGELQLARVVLTSSVVRERERERERDREREKERLSGDKKATDKS